MKQKIGLSVCIILFLTIGIMTSCKATNNEMSTTHNAIVENQPDDDAPVSELILGDWYLKNGNSYQPCATFNADGTFSFFESSWEVWYYGTYKVDSDVKNLDFLSYHSKFNDDEKEPRSFSFLETGRPWATEGHLWFVDSNSLVIKWYNDSDSSLEIFSRTAPQKGDLYNQLINSSWNYVNGNDNETYNQVQSITFYSDNEGDHLKILFRDDSEENDFLFRIDEDNKSLYFHAEHPISWGLNSDQWELIDENTMYFCGCKMTRVK